MIKKPTEERFISYSLSGLFPEESRVVLDHELQILSWLRPLESGPWTIVEQQQFTDVEWSLLVELLASYPYYCPLEQLLAAQSGRSIERCREQLNLAYEEGVADAVMRPMRGVLSRCRIKLQMFGITIRSVLETGYTLMENQKRKTSEGNGPSDHTRYMNNR